MARLKVGVVGVAPGSGLSWGARAHVPALRALPDRFELLGVANTSAESARAAAQDFGIPRAYDNVAAMVADPEIDLVSVAVRVPYHFEIVQAALVAGKHVYCEWPLGNGLAEARQMAEMARKAGVKAVVGTQARVAPTVQLLKRLVAEGRIGRVLSSTITARGRNWGAVLDSYKVRGYLLDAKNGATMTSIMMSHTLAAVQEALGDIADVSAMIETLRPTTYALDIGREVPMTAPDQAVFTGHLGGGAVFSMHFRGGDPRGVPGFLWEICGTEGDVRIEGVNGNSQMIDLKISAGLGREGQIAPLELPADLTAGWPVKIIPGNVARVYARMAQDIAQGTRSAPDFEDAVQLHELLDTIERAALGGERLRPPSKVRPLDPFA